MAVALFANPLALIALEVLLFLQLLHRLLNRIAPGTLELLFALFVLVAEFSELANHFLNSVIEVRSCTSLHGRKIRVEFIIELRVCLELPVLFSEKEAPNEGLHTD